MTTGNWSPFYFKQNNKYHGIAIDFWNIIAKSANISYSCDSTNNFNNVLNGIKNKSIDITLATAITKDRLEYANFSKSYISYPIAIVTKVNKNFIAKTSYLNGKKVAVGRGYTSYKILSAKYPNINFIQTKNTDEALKLVSDGIAYAAVDILPVLSYKIQENNFNNLKISGTTKFNFDVRIMVRKDYKELLSIINKSIDTIDEKNIDVISNKWLKIKYSEYNDYSLIWKILGACVLIFIFLLYKHNILKSQHEKLKITKHKLEITQKKLKHLNSILEQRVLEEVEKNRHTDMKMLQQSRLAQLGEMISMIAHQWRQPLNAIAASVMSVQLKLEYKKYDMKEEEDRNYFLSFLDEKLINIETFTQSLTTTIDDFRNFYKPNKQHEFQVVNKPVQMAVNIIKSTLEAEHIKLFEEYNSKQKIDIYKNELMQVLLNILKNSLDQIKLQDIQDPLIKITTYDSKKETIIQILDNAGGINSAITEKIFDPYFSTKDEHNGSGLGLYMSKIIIEDHHKGKLEIINKDDGICVSIIIPKTIYD
jgi:signal transduction histidine kinase